MTAFRPLKPNDTNGPKPTFEFNLNAAADPVEGDIRFDGLLNVYLALDCTRGLTDERKLCSSLNHC